MFVSHGHHLRQGARYQFSLSDYFVFSLCLFLRREKPGQCHLWYSTHTNGERWRTRGNPIHCGVAGVNFPRKREVCQSDELCCVLCFLYQQVWWISLCWFAVHGVLDLTEHRLAGSAIALLYSRILQAMLILGYPQVMKNTMSYSQWVLIHHIT